ncbi:hypothetical protein EAL2_c10260 [Peptoclostridium acidaminophilum DSM 3953]|uniref:HNH nuclease domain-containing protein n=1 Tax=Peptoclostridium acidaminophilum DSM 3953 TaxID=1286171 RepID=W8T3H9_PEPAC|nr:HNH endonuclease [Peptoclostridium acidaminophilum]AHM56324.1 hypothetical protein EAL2_c10260 [Peptoclostridium acidaminophilum DSM 3953]
MKATENYVYKKEVDWSLLNEGLTLPVENQVVFGRNMGKFLARGEAKNITVYLDGKSYIARIINLNLNKKHNRKSDMLQIRYSSSSELSNALKAYFTKSYQYISNKRNLREKSDRSIIRLPEDHKEYLAIYTTEYEDTYLFETIVAEDIYQLKEIVKNKQEYLLEASFNYDVIDEKSTLFETERIMKIRKLNKKIGDNLKLLYNFRCQICGEDVGKKYDSQIVEAHHIEYFVRSLNNDSNNQLIVCPNHHRIIHSTNATFYRNRLAYLYPNGVQERLVLNKHLR